MIPLPPIRDEARWRQLLDPHLRRLRLAKMFRVDASWTGMEAVEFAALVDYLAKWIDHEGSWQMINAHLQAIDAGHAIEPDTPDCVLSPDGFLWENEVEDLVTCLEMGCEPGHMALLRGTGVTRVLEMVENMLHMTYSTIPATLKELGLPAGPLH